MNRRGMTLIELLVGMATAAILVGVCAKVIQLGVVTYGYASRQNASLTKTRKAMTGDGVRAGILGSSREGYAFASLQTSSVSILSSSTPIVTMYYVANGNLNRSRSGTTIVQADGVNSLALNYYMATGGLISSTTNVSSATMVTALVTVGTGTASSAQKPYALYTGARLRNHQ